MLKKENSAVLHKCEECKIFGTIPYRFMLLSTHLFTTIFTAIIYNISEYIYSEIFTSYSHYGYNGKIIAEDIGTGPSLLAISQSRSSIPSINQSATSHRSRVSKFTNHTAAPFTKRMCINIIAIPN